MNATTRWDIFCGRLGLRWEFFRSRWNHRDTNFWILFCALHCLVHVVFVDWTSSHPPLLWLIPSTAIFMAQVDAAFIIVWRPYFQIGGPLPLYMRGHPHYADIWHTQLNQPTDQYHTYYTYVWTHWHEMEERLLAILTTRALLCGA